MIELETDKVLIIFIGELQAAILESVLGAVLGIHKEAVCRNYIGGSGTGIDGGAGEILAEKHLGSYRS